MKQLLPWKQKFQRNVRRLLRKKAEMNKIETFYLLEVFPMKTVLMELYLNYLDFELMPP